MTKPLLALFAAALIVGVTSSADAQRAQQLQRISPDEVTRAADQLGTRTEQFVSTAERVGGYERVAARADRVVRQAEDMRRMIERRGPTQRVVRDYSELQRDFQQLREEFIRTHSMRPNRQVQRAWYNVVLAHEALALALGTPDPRRGQQPRWHEHEDWERDIRFR